MSRPVLRYAITDRRLHGADERDPAAPRPASSRTEEIGSEGPALGPSSRPEERGAGVSLLASKSKSPVSSPPLLHLPRLIHQAQHLHRAGIDFLQLREKDLPAAHLHSVAQSLRQAISPGTRPRLLLNLGHLEDRATNIRVALAHRLDGLHLPADTPPDIATDIRTAFRRAGLPPPILSISAHTLAEITAATRTIAPDLILFGPVFGKTIAGSEVAPALGLEALAAAVRAAAATPVLALGGLNPANAEACLAAGAAGIAGIRLFQRPV